MVCFVSVIGTFCNSDLFAAHALKTVRISTCPPYITSAGGYSDFEFCNGRVANYPLPGDIPKPGPLGLDSLLAFARIPCSLSERSGPVRRNCGGDPAQRGCGELHLLEVIHLRQDRIYLKRLPWPHTTQR